MCKKSEGREFVRRVKRSAGPPKRSAQGADRGPAKPGGLGARPSQRQGPSGSTTRRRAVANEPSGAQGGRYWIQGKQVGLRARIENIERLAAEAPRLLSHQTKALELRGAVIAARDAGPGQGCRQLALAARQMADDFQQRYGSVERRAVTEGLQKCHRQAQALKKRLDTRCVQDLQALERQVGQVAENTRAYVKQMGLSAIDEGEAQRQYAELRQRFLCEISREYVAKLDDAAPEHAKAFLDELMERLGLEIIEARVGGRVNERVHEVIRAERRDPGLGDGVIVDVVTIGYRELDTGKVVPPQVVVNRR